MNVTAPNILLLNDGVLFVIDCMKEPNNKNIIFMKTAIEKTITTVVMIDRIKTIIPLPVNSAYAQIVAAIEALRQLYTHKENKLSPKNGTICFRSSEHGWAITIPHLIRACLFK
jgi:hypothetical protein